MRIKKLTSVVICYLILSIPSYSFGTQTTSNDDNTDIEAVQPGTNDQIGNMLLQSVSLIGIPYKWGGNTPNSGLDCSGFIRYIFKKSLGITLPRTANEMADLGRKIPANQLEPGDLMFFKISGGRRITHVGMYLGQGKFIQSPRTGKDIEISEFNDYYRTKFVVAKRMVQEDITDNNQTVLSDIRDERDAFATKRSIKTKKHHRKKSIR